MSIEEKQAGAAKAALVEALRSGRDTFQMPIYPGGFSNEVARAIEAMVEARIAVREREIIEHMKVAFGLEIETC